MARSKYRNVRTTVDGITFASKAEAKRYGELKLLERAKEICKLERQPRFPLRVGTAGELICTYVGDFAYCNGPHWNITSRRIVEDVKGKATEAFKIKWKLANTLYPGVTWRIIPV